MAYQRFSQVRSDHIEYAFWLVFGADGSMSFSRGQPGIVRGQRAVSCTAKLPTSLFRTPTLKMIMTVDDASAADMQIDTVAASDMLKKALGVDIDIKVNPTEQQ